MILSAWQTDCKACGNVGGVDVTGGASKARMQNHTSTHRSSPYEENYVIADIYGLCEWYKDRNDFKGVGI